MSMKAKQMDGVQQLALPDRGIGESLAGTILSFTDVRTQHRGEFFKMLG